MSTKTERICKNCDSQLGKDGYYCCDEYYCSDACLNKSFEGTGTTWDEHYSGDHYLDAGDCYWTEWEDGE